MSFTRLLALLCWLLMLATTPVGAAPRVVAAGPYGEPLILEASGFFGPEQAPRVIRDWAGPDVVQGAWPATVTLQCWRFGARDESTSRRVLILGGIHGDEAVSYLLAQRLVEQLSSEALDESREGALIDALAEAGIQLYIVPLLNPYGTLAGVRTNFRRPTALETELSLAAPGDIPWLPEWWPYRLGVDLNRNFPVNLPCGEEWQRPDGEGTHDFDAPGGCWQQELYYGALLPMTCEPEPANVWLWGLISAITPEVTLALHQEARVAYVDVAEAHETAAPKWAPVLNVTHDYLNGFLDAANPDPLIPRVEFGLNKEDRAIDPVNLVNDFSPGGYGAALSLKTGVVLTVEMSSFQEDQVDQACWFPEGVLYTYQPTLRGPVVNSARYESVVERFKAPLLNFIFHLDPTAPEGFTMVIGRDEANALMR